MMKQRSTWLPASSEQRPGKVEEQEVPAGQEEQARPTEYIFPPDKLPALDKQSRSFIVNAMIRDRHANPNHILHLDIYQKSIYVRRSLQ